MIDLFQKGMNFWNDGLMSLMPSAFLVYIAILWISLIFWTIRDSFLRSKNFFFQFFATFLVTFFSIFGFFIYLIIRPPLFLAEKELLEPENRECEKKLLSCPKCQSPLKSNKKKKLSNLPP